MNIETTHTDNKTSLRGTKQSLPLVPNLRFKEFDDDWVNSRLYDLSKLITKGTTPKSFTSEGVNYVKIEGLQGVHIIKEKCRYINEEVHLKELKRSILQDKDLLFAIAGATVGKVGIVTPAILPANTNQALAIIRLKDKKYLNYILQILQSRVMKKYIYQSVSVGAQPNLNLEQIGEFRFNLPTLPEQQKIASFLTAVDTKIQQLTKKAALLAKYKKGVMQQLFSGELRFKDEHGNTYPDWEEKRLGEIVAIMTDYVAAGSFESLRNNVTVYDELNYALYVRLTDLRRKLKHSSLKYVDKSSFEFLSKSNLYGGELLLANIGANVGDVYLMPFNIGYATIAPNMIVVRENIDKFYSIYLFYHLNSHGGRKEINKAISGSGQPKLSKTDFKKVKLNLPSIKEQQKIATYLSSIDTKIERVNNQITQTQTFKKGLLQQLFV